MMQSQNTTKKETATMEANRGYPHNGGPRHVRPTSLTPATDRTADDVLAIAARLRTARIATAAMDPAAVATIAQELLERGHYRAAITAAELAEQLAEIATATTASRAARELFGRPRDAENCAYPGDHEHDHHMCLDALEDRRRAVDATVLIPVIRHFCATCGGPVRWAGPAPARWVHLLTPGTPADHAAVVR